MESCGGVLGFEDLTELKFTNQVLKESLRILPVVPVLMRETVENDKLGGFAIPGGTKVREYFIKAKSVHPHTHTFLFKHYSRRAA